MNTNTHTHTQDEEQQQDDGALCMTKSSNLRRFDSGLSSKRIEQSVITQKSLTRKSSSSIKLLEYRAEILAHTRKPFADVVFTLRDSSSQPRRQISTSSLPSIPLLNKSSSSSYTQKQRKTLKLRYDNITDAMDFLQYDISRGPVNNSMAIVRRSPDGKKSRKRLARMRNERRETYRIFAYETFKNKKDIRFVPLEFEVRSGMLFGFEPKTNNKIVSLDVRDAQVEQIRLVTAYKCGDFTTFRILAFRRVIMISSLETKALSSFRNLVVLCSVCRVDPILPSQLEIFRRGGALGT